MSKNAIFSVWIQRIAILPCNLKLYTQLANILLDCSSKFDIGETNEFHWSDGQMVSDNFRAQRLVRCSTIYNQFKKINTAATEGLNQGQVQGSTVCPKKRTTYFQMVVTQLRIVEITIVGRVLERAGADHSNAYNNLLSLKYEPRYLRSKLTQYTM